MIDNTVIACSICNRHFRHRNHIRSHFVRVHRGQPIRTYIPSVESIHENNGDLGFRPAHLLVDENGLRLFSTVSHFNNETVCFTVFNFFAHFDDRTDPVYSRPPSINTDRTSLPISVQICVNYVCKNSLSYADCEQYYHHIMGRDAEVNTSPQLRMLGHFQTIKHFYNYCANNRKMTVVDNGWVRGRIQLDNCPINTTGYFQCPNQLLKSILWDVGAAANIITHLESQNSGEERTYSCSCDTDFYRSYQSDISSDHVVLVDYYSDGTTITCSGTQSATFIWVSFSNIKTISENW